MTEAVPATDRPRTPHGILASFVPQLVLERMGQLGDCAPQPQIDRLAGAVLFADISGFTALTERLAARGPAGIELLVRRLNAYFGRLIDVVLGHGGDVLKFAGDALVVHFPGDGTTEHAGGSEAAARAAACALALQTAVQDESADAEGPTLQLKVAVAQGSLACAFLGGVRSRWELVVHGPPLREAGVAAEACAPGWVVLSPSAWQGIAADAVGEPITDFAVRLLRAPKVETRPPAAQPEPDSRVAQAAWQFVPHAIRARLASGQGDWLAELRRITVIFVTLPGRLGDAGLAETQGLMTRLQNLIYRVEGSVNKISVDDKGLSLVAVLGMPPLSHEDDPRRGLMLALDIHELMLQLDLQPLIGVTTGRAFCGVIGNERRREYTMIGDIVNLSARLMVASAGQVLCDQASRDGAVDHFDFEPMAPLALKGKRMPVAVYRPSRKAGRRLQVGNRFVGRERESRLLGEALSALLDGQSSAFVLEGEPGSGKSRLLDEIVAQARGIGVRVLRGGGDSIERTTAYLSWRDILSGVLGDADGGPMPAASTMPAHLAARVDLHDAAPLLNDILPLGLTDTDFTRELEAEARAAALRRLVGELLDDGTPLLLVVDDLQWLDSASWALLMAVVRRVEPLLLLCASRPMSASESTLEQRELLRRPRTRVLRLEGFDPPAIAELVRARLDVDQVSPALVRFIAERTQGNAFFIEQLLLALRDARLLDVRDRRCDVRPEVDLAAETGLPDTVEGAITQRIDHLDPTEQLLLKVASVVGRSFAARLIDAIFPIEQLRGRLQPFLDRLAQCGLTEIEVGEADLRYLFRHILTRQVAYNLMLFSQRQALHQAVAGWYEDSFADRSPFFALIAHHLVQAGATHRAVHYLILAGDQALSRFACAEAVELFGEAIRLLDATGAGAPASADTRAQRRHCRLQMGHACYLMGRMEQGIVEMRRGLARSEAAVPESRFGKLIAVLRETGVQMLRRGGWTAPRKPAAPSAQAALAAYAQAYRDLSTCHYIRSEILDLVHCGLRGLNFAERLGDGAALAEALAHMSVIASAAGRRAAGADYAARAEALLPLLTDPARRANMLVALGIYRSTRCEWDAAISLYEIVVERADSISNYRLLQIGLYGMGRSAMRAGRLDLSQRIFERLEALGRSVDNGQASAWGLSGMLQSQLADEQTHWPTRMAAMRSLLSAESGRGHLTATDLALCHGAIALTLLRLDRGDEAEQEALRTGDVILGTDAVATYMLDPLTWTCDIHLARWRQLGDAKGRHRRRLRQLGKVLGTFARKYAFAPPMAWRIRGELRSLEGDARRGCEDIRRALEAATARTMPCEVARCHEALAEHLPRGPSADQHRRTALDHYRALGMLVDLDRLESRAPALA